MFFNSIRLNCTKDVAIYCTQNESAGLKLYHIFYIMITAIGAFGFSANLLSFYVFTNCRDHLNKKFKETMEIYLLNSLVYSACDFMIGITWLAMTKTIYEEPSFTFELMLSYELMFCLVYLRLNIGSILYVFGSLMDIYITWGRIQKFKPNYTFLLNISVKRVSFIFLVISILLTIPIGLSRELVQFEFNSKEKNTSALLYTYDITRFKNSQMSQLVEYSVYIANTIRDVVSLVLEIVLDIMLVFLFGRFVINKARLTGRSDETLNSHERANLVITLILSVLSIFLHSFTFLVFISTTFTIKSKMFSYMFGLSGLFGGFKHAINIFILYAHNVEFRKKFNFLVLDN